MTRVIKDVYYDSARPKLQVMYFDGAKLTHIENIVNSVKINGDVAKAGRSCEVSFKNTDDARKRLVNVANGKEVRILADELELFRGNIFKFGRTATGDESLTAYDSNIYLAKNNDVVKFVGKKASEIIKLLCSQYGIKTGRIDDTGHAIPKLILPGKTLYDIFIIALTETQQATGQRFMLRNNKGSLELIKVQAATNWLRIEPGKNLIDASYSESIDDVKTKVKLTGGDEKNPVTATVGGGGAYGTMQHYEHNSSVSTASQLKSIATGMLSVLSKPDIEMSVEVLGIPQIVSGTALIVQDALSGLTGGYFVLSDNHSFDSKGVHTMSLNLSKTLDLPFMEYEPPEEPAANSAINDGSGDTYNVKYTSGWIATAYDPKLGGINGSGDYSLTASGTKWAYKRTIAVDPKVIPYGSVVAIKVPSMPEYSGLYLAEDTGGAIKGKRIDILIKGKSATAKFGRRNVEVAILEVGKGKAEAAAKVKNWKSVKSNWNNRMTAKPVTTGNAKGVRQEVVNMAAYFKGKIKYHIGSTSVKVGGVADCSAFTQYVYKNAAGKSIGRDTLSQVKKGVKVPTAEAQPGDLVFFQGTYRTGVSHVGIVTRPGYCISLQGSGVIEHGYLPSTNSYWGKHFMQIRRVL
jgi:cell wall-associated NlpC family hydrolase